MFPNSGFPMRPEDMAMGPPMGQAGFPDHGDGFGEYYGMEQMYKDDHGDEQRSPTRRKRRGHKQRDEKRARSTSGSDSHKTRTISKSRSQSRSRTRSRSRSRSSSRTCSPAESRPTKEIKYREPSVLDAFRILYLTPSIHNKSTSRYLATKKKQDRIQEYLKSDGLGSKKWLFYPRPQKANDVDAKKKSAPVRENCDQRVKIDAAFFRKYKRNKRIDIDSPLAKLKTWELVLYKKLGFIHAV